MRYSHGAPVEISAADASRQFSKWSEAARKTPVVVMRHGRPSIVLVSADHYAQSMTSPDPEAGAPAEAALTALLDHATEAFFACDGQMRFTRVNPVFETLIGRAAHQVLGHPICLAFPAHHAAILVEQLEAVMQAGEATEVELREDGRVLLMRLFPYPGGVAALVLNRSRELALRLRWARHEAKSAALAVLPQVACVELNLRGVFDRVDPAFCELVGFGEEELRRFRLTEIVHPKVRTAFIQAFETAVQGQAAAIPTILLSKGGHHRAVDLAVALTKHQGLPEAIMVIVRAS